MRILLVDKEKITKLTLPNEVDGAFLIDYYPVVSRIKRELNVESLNNQWVIKSNETFSIVSNNHIEGIVTLQDYAHYNLLLNNLDERIDLYCLPSIDDRFFRIATNITQILIGSSTQCNIIYNDPSVLAIHAGITNQEGTWYIQTPEGVENCYVYLNNKAIKKATKLKTGDIIFINGLKMIWMYNFIQVCNPEDKVCINSSNTNLFEVKKINNTDYREVTEEEKAFELYRPEDYFFHTPNLKEYIKNTEISIDNPPNSEIKPDNGLMTSAASITLLASSFASGFNIINSLNSGTEIIKLVPQFVTFGAMVISSLLMPKIAEKHNNKVLEKRERFRKNKYNSYLESKEREIISEMNRQTQVLEANFLRIDSCLNFLNRSNDYIWTREIKDDDFLEIRLGCGDKDADITINADEEHFTLYDDELLSNVHSIVKASRKLENVPITINLREKRVSAIICESPYKEDFFNSIISQLAIYHSAADLKIVFLTNKTNKNYDLSYAKFFPHCFSGDKTIRFYSENTDEMKSISSYLDNIFKERTEGITKESEEVEIKEDQENGYRKYDTYYLIITNDYVNAKELPIIENILNSNNNFGFSLLILDTMINKLPNGCRTFVSILDNEGVLMERTLNSQIKFLPEYVASINMNDVGKRLLNIPLAEVDVQSTLPNSLTFLEMFNVSKIEQLNIANRWKSSDPTFSLASPIGVHTSGELFNLDLHEKHHGPHGLIAGSTGSGKSEFIITFILSMCVNFHPDEVQFVLIDYKGGGLTGAFENRELKQVVPHIAGTITNLDANAINRSLVSINSELKRRQRKFNEAKTTTGESTIDIYKYQKFYREGLVKEPISHLFIVSDEFAELKAQQPEFMDELVSTARIGRSLGVHLILATQKPTGVVNEQIWSNSKFKICLKVANKGDSMEMLKRPEAASIKEAGRFYLQVGYDEYFDIGQSGYSGAKYIPSDRIIKTTDDTIQFINNTGTTIKTIDNIIKKVETKDMGDQLTNITKTLINLAAKDNFKIRKLWLDNIPELIYIGNLKEKYGYQAKPYYIDPIIGEYDNPEEQVQDLLKLDITGKGNTVIFGASGMGQDNLLSTIIYTSSIEHSPEEIYFYIIDLGAETLKQYAKMPHVADICTIDDQEKTQDMLFMIEEELEKRKELFSDFNGEYTYYIEKSGEKLPYIVCIINNYDVFTETYSKLTDALGPIYRECSKYGICFIVTCASMSSIRSKIADYFPNKLCLRMPKDEDYRNLLNSKKGLIPTNCFGRGIVKIDKNCYEFQSAYIFTKDQISETIKATCVTLKEQYKNFNPKRVPILPDVVTKSFIESDTKGLESTPIGIDMNNKQIYSFNFAKEKTAMILGNDLDEIIPFLYPFTSIVSNIPNLKEYVIDFSGKLDRTKTSGEMSSTDFNNEIAKMNKVLADPNLASFEKVYILVEAGLAKEKLQPNDYQTLNNIIKALPNLNNTHFIFVGANDNHKKLQLEGWYENIMVPNYGIWIGEGVDSQTSITFKGLSSDVRRINISDMAFVANKNEITIIRKVVENENPEGEIENEQ